MAWLKWTPAQTRDITILSSQPVESFIHWTGAGSIPCDRADCALCAQGSRPKHRWSVEVREGDEGHTWEMSNQVYVNLCAISHKLQAFAGLQISITRNGSGMATTYTLIPTGTVDPASLPPIQQATSTPGHFGADVAAEQARTAAAIAQTIKHLCAETGLDAKVEFTAWLLEEGKPYTDSTPDIQLERFCDYLEDCTAQPTDRDARPLTASSLLDMPQGEILF